MAAGIYRGSVVIVNTIDLAVANCSQSRRRVPPLFWDEQLRKRSQIQREGGA
jgi:hypothetical protein